MSRLAVAAVALLLLAAAPQQPPTPDDGVSVDQIENDYLERLAKAEQARDWKTFFAHVQAGLHRKASKVVPLGKDRWVGMREYLAGRLAALPKDALEHYRLHQDGPAAAEFARARESGTRRDVERAADTYFFSSGADEVVDVLAQTAFDEGRPGEAAALWTRLLRYYPDPDVPRAVLAARAAQACTAAGDESGLEELRRLVAEKKVAGRIRAAGRDVELSSFLAAVEIPLPPPPVPAVREPLVRSPLDRERAPSASNDIKRWSYDFAADRGEAVPEPPAPPVVRGRARFNPRIDPNAAPVSPDFPYFPAYAKLRGRDYVVFTDGSRVLAIDPSRVKTGSTSAGVYWKYPHDRSIVRGVPTSAGMLSRPYTGVAIDGEYAYVTMYSKLESRPREVVGQEIPFEGLTAVKCLHIPSGRLIWDTDLDPLLGESRKLPFYDKAFSYTGPPVLSGDRVFLGVCSSPASEQESWVLCLDRATGRPVWSTPLATLAAGAGGRMAMFMQRPGTLFQTTLVAQGGSVYAQTNIGAAASLNAVTGDVQWLARYPRTGMKVQNSGVMDYSFVRAANWPVLWKGRMFLLPQDRADLLALETATGRSLPLPALRVLREDRPVELRELHQLLGVVNDWLVLGGQQTHVVRLKDFTAFTLAASDTHASGRGTIRDGQVYLPVCTTGASGDEKGGGGISGGVLGVYAPPPSWRCTGQYPWKGPNEYGNLLVAGDYLVVATDRLSVYTEVETLRREYGPRLAASPPRADVLLEYGDAMRENERLEEAAEAYLRFIAAAEGDARWEARSRQVQRDLHAIFLRRGDESGDPARALEHYAYAKRFAFDDASRAEAVRRLAGGFEKSGRWKEAVEQYQELIERARSQYHRQGEEVRKLWQHARDRVDDIVKKAPEAYEDVEKNAREAFEKAKDGGEEALRAVLDRFPNSKSARDAWKALRERLSAEGALERLRGYYKDFEERFKESLDFDGHKDFLELLEKLKDGVRMRVELDRFESRFGERAIGAPGAETTVKEWTARKRAALAGPVPARAFKAGPAVATAKLQGPLRPLAPAGEVPAGLPAGAEVCGRGSGVELIDPATGKVLWARPKPGVWTGFVLGDKDVVTQVHAGSPADKAGLKRGDVVVSLEMPAEPRPGATAEACVARGGQDLRLRLELAAPPAEPGSGLLGAAWTGGGLLAVVWDDVVAAFDPATGTPRWSFRDLAPGAALRAFQAVEGRLICYEDDRAEGGPRRPSLRAIRARVLALNDFTGDLAWAYAMDVEAAPQGGVDVDVKLFGRPGGAWLGLLQTQTRGGNREDALWSFRAGPGGKPEKRSLPGRVAAQAADEARGIFYAVCELGDRQERILLSRSLDPERRDFKAMDVPLKGGELAPPGAPLFGLAAEGDILCLLSVAGAEQRLRVFKAGQSLRALKLPEGRVLPPQAAPALLLSSGVLAVYNVPRQAGGEPRAFLTAFRPEAGEDPLWDAPAPVSSSTSAVWTLAAGEGRFLALSSPQGSPPGRPGEGGVAAVYDLPGEGYLRLVRTPLAAVAEPVVFSRGRMYLQSREAAEIYDE